MLKKCFIFSNNNPIMFIIIVSFGQVQMSIIRSVKTVNIFKKRTIVKMAAAAFFKK